MKPRERRDSGQGDLLRSLLDAKVDWGFLEEKFGVAYRDGPGQPPPLMTGLIVLNTPTTSPTRSCARAGWRTPIISSFQDQLVLEELLPAETGRDHDLRLAQEIITGNVTFLVSLSPPSKHAVVLGLGDLLAATTGRASRRIAALELVMNGKWSDLT